MSYAVATTLLNTEIDSDNLKIKLNTSMSSSKLWITVNQLVINESRTENVIFTLKYTLASNHHSLLKLTKLLGIVLDSKLT